MSERMIILNESDNKYVCVELFYEVSIFIREPKCFMTIEISWFIESRFTKTLQYISFWDEVLL